MSSSPSELKFDIVCLGEALIDFVATTAGVPVGKSEGFIRAAGGAPANVAVGVARLGGKVAFHGKVGDDPFGHHIEEILSASGVNTNGMVFSPDYRTSLAFVSRQENGERDFCFFRNPGADMTFAPKELRSNLLNASIFHFGSISLIDEPAAETTLEAVRQSRENGALISFDPNLRVPLWPSLEVARETILSAIPKADLLKVNEDEAIFLTRGVLPNQPVAQIQAVRAIEQLAEDYPNLALIIVTLGSKGAHAICDGKHYYGHANSVKAVDTTGAGDGFVAGLLTSLCEAKMTSVDSIRSLGDARLLKILDFANAVGAIATTKLGAIPALPLRAEVKAFLGNDPTA